MKDGQLRGGSVILLCLTLAGLFAGLGFSLWQCLKLHEPVPVGRRSADSLLQAWHFVRRCAPDSAAPPLFG
jgi:hypothetical protein